ncbi:DUF1566 domain-containing protein [Labilibaculum sp.]|uniref:Lcl C-terminal domain-containing protein n=1 Tax=Labilibaculum sp. TaxID=2060723 RepID=UPI0035617B40
MISLNLNQTKFLKVSLLSLFLLFASCSKDSSDDIDETSEENLPNISAYPIVGTNLSAAFNNYTEITIPNSDGDFYGQNANYPGNEPSYTNNGDGTITDNITGLMWSQTADLNGDGIIDADDKLSLTDAIEGAETFSLGGYNDWRLPTIKEAYSLIIFNGKDPSSYEGTSTENLIPFIDTNYFEFGYGDQDAGERIIDAQYASSTKYVDYTMNDNETMFGVNFADGRIKGYPISIANADKTFYVAYVRENTSYGENSFTNNGDKTISDAATGLMWMQNDSETDGMNWKEALIYAENFEFAGYSDWRLPDIKELQSLVDYTRSPQSTNSAAINALFNCTEILNENNETDYSYYWSSTTHVAYSSEQNGTSAAYLSFGRAMGYMSSSWIDVHGAGAQRSDPKTGDPDDYPTGWGPQGDARRIYNQVRLVRNIE